MSTRHALLLQALIRKAEAIEKMIRVVTMHEEGLEATVISERLGVSSRYVEKKLARMRLKTNPPEKNYLRNDRRFGKAADR